MILFFYNLVLVLALVLGAPWWLYRLATTQKYREGLLERLGSVPPRLRGTEKPVIWLHAVSVGEVLAVSRLVAELDRALPHHRLLISTTTRTGQALARERFGKDRVIYCPLDLPWAVHAYLEALRPEMLILAETEFWPNLLSSCFRRGVQVSVVNARLSDRSWPRYWRLRRLWKPILGKLSAIMAQSNLDAERLRALGCATDRVTVSGNLKFDVRAATDSPALQLLRLNSGGLRWIVAGSTVDGEESMLLAAWPELLKIDPSMAMILAPRHPERFQAAAGELVRSGIFWRRRSELAETETIRAGEIVLLDTIGELASLYALATVAFVGGSLVPSGGHNPLEPAQFGAPILMGGHYANFRVMVDQLRLRDAIMITTPADLSTAFMKLLQNADQAVAMGERANQLFEAQSGATATTLAVLQTLVNSRSLPRGAS